MNTKHLLVISFDAVSSSDYTLLNSLPNFSKIMHEGSYVKNVKTIYPSLTYPAHVSIITGKQPKDHGIVNNTLLQPRSNSPDWFWHYKHIKCKTLFDAAREANLTTASLFWPVTAKAKINYNMPEIFPNKSWKNQIVLSLLNGSPLFQFQLNNKYGNIRKGLHQPELDDFTLASMVHLIKTKKPNLIMTHLIDVDTQRHRYGFNSKEAIDAVTRHDARLGKVINAVKDAGILEDTTIVALGDHSQIDATKMINLNVLFVQNSLIDLDKNGNIKNWQAYAKSCDGSVYIYLKCTNDDVKSKVNNIINSFVQLPDSGVEKVYSNSEAKAMGADDKCYLMLEAKEGYYFIDNTQGDVIESIYDTHKNRKIHKATHGYNPSKPNYGTFFIAYGKGIKKGKVIDEINLIDEGPTFAKLLGINLDDCHGRVVEEILE